MVGSAHAGEIVQYGAPVPLQQEPERVFAVLAHLRHEGEVVGFGLDGIGHEEAFLDQFRIKEKPFGERLSRRKIGVNRQRRSGAYTELKLEFRKGNAT